MRQALCAWARMDGKDAHSGLEIGPTKRARWDAQCVLRRKLLNPSGGVYPGVVARVPPPLPSDKLAWCRSQLVHSETLHDWPAETRVYELSISEGVVRLQLKADQLRLKLRRG